MSTECGVSIFLFELVKKKKTSPSYEMNVGSWVLIT